jgi:hypothetical protein
MNLQNTDLMRLSHAHWKCIVHVHLHCQVLTALLAGTADQTRIAETLLLLYTQYERHCWRAHVAVLRVQVLRIFLQAPPSFAHVEHGVAFGTQHDQSLGFRASHGPWHSKCWSDDLLPATHATYPGLQRGLAG